MDAVCDGHNRTEQPIGRAARLRVRKGTALRALRFAIIFGLLAALAVPASPAGGRVPGVGAGYGVDVAPSDVWSSDRVHCGDPATSVDPGSGGFDRLANLAAPGPSVRRFHLGDLEDGAAGTREETAVVPGRRSRSGPGELLTFRIEVDQDVAVDPVCFALTVESILWDARSWGGTGELAFARVDGESYDFRVILASPQRTRRLCWPLRTGLTLSCQRNDRVVVNAWRWQNGAGAFNGDLEAYRRYLINHEVGHVLGYGHRSCPGPGSTAPVMMQQTKGVGDCRANGWPLPSELSP